MSDSSKAVFLSYASQDAEAAKRIAESLRSAGVEVWFDTDGGLEHGDEWDAKIRRQIKDCVLFIAIVSASTQAREEGYFRIEWELAAQRALGIASGVAFILPVVIDDTHEPEALVPDRFRTVQWTKLPGGVVAPEVQARFLKLWSHRAGVVSHQAMEAGRVRPAGQRGGGTPAPLKPGWKVYAGLAAAIFALVAVAGWWLLRGSGGRPEAASVAPLSPARKLAEQARALFMNRLDTSRDDCALADELLQRAQGLDSTDAEVWALAAHLHSYYQLRGWDNSDARRESARLAAQRAVRLDPRSFEARLAQAFLLPDTGREGEEKERLLRELRQEQPADKRLLRALATVVNRLGRLEEANALNDESARLPGGDPIALYNKSLNRWFSGHTVEAEAAMQEALAQHPFTGALLFQAWYAAILHGDLEQARVALAQVPVAEMQEDRAAFYGYYIELLAHQPDAAIARLAAVPRPWLNDNWYRGPKGRLVGDALLAGGRRAAAEFEWRSALKQVDEQLGAAPNDPVLNYNRVLLLAKLGERKEAEAQFAVLTQRVGIDPAGNEAVPPWVTTTCILLGRKAEAIRQIARGLQRERRAVDYTSVILRLDPRFDPLRSEPDFTRLIAEAAAIEQAAVAAAVVRDWPKDPELKRVMAMLSRFDAIPEDFKLVEEIVQKALDKAPTDPEPMTAMARVQSMWLLRGWDRTEERFQLAKKICERAVQLAPDSPEALGALGVYLTHRGGEQERSRQLLERAAELAPNDSFYHRMLANAVFQGRATPAEALATIQRTVARFPADPLAHYDLARYYRDAGNWAEFERALDATIALAPVANALVWKARAEFAFRDDLPAMKATLDRVPPRVRAVERTVFTYFTYAVMSGKYGEGLEAVQMMSDLWMSDFDYRGPKALLTAELLKLQGKPAMARLQYEAALAEVQKFKARYPGDAAAAASEAWVLHGLGRDEEARAANQVVLESLNRPYRLAVMNSWWFQSIPLNLLVGERATALQLIGEAVESKPAIRGLLRQRLKNDARMAAWRADPELTALLAEPEEKK